MTLDPPVLVIVSDRAPLLPTVTLPKLRLLGFGPSPPGEAPVPANAKVRDGLEAFEVMVTVPLALPADCGAKVTVKVVLCDGLRVSGVVIPLKVNPAPLIPA